MNFVGTIWALLPPIIAIALALITKEVYLSLFIGVVSGAMLYANFDFMGTINTIFDVMSVKLGDSWNVGILIFLVFLGIMVALMTRAGGSAAYGKWAGRKIKTRRGAMLATIGLGCLIFVDDYFNCLTVGSVMRPVTDKHNISRAKLAYLIDATAAPVCIIAPISSWAAAVTGYTSGDGFKLFLSTIPFNMYALLTIGMLLFTTLISLDFGAMGAHERAAQQGDLWNGVNDYKSDEETEVSEKGRVLDLILPVAVLIVSCILCMVYTGGFFEGTPFVEAFAGCDASRGLVLGSFFALIFTFLLYVPRKLISFREFADCIPKGFRMMVSAILILTLAWTLGGLVRDNLCAGDFVSAWIKASNFSTALMPCLLFLIALGIAFATGTSWGTFAILIPIVTAVFPEGTAMLTISIASILAGAVCGDHISPISDTTIMASTGAQCNHVAHVSTQIPYAMIPAACCVISYLVAGFTQSLIATLVTGFALMILILMLIKWSTRRKAR